MAAKYGVVALAFGVPSSIESNRVIAELAMSHARKLQAPIFTQTDVSIPAEYDVEYQQQEPDQPPPTLCIARAAVEWAVRRKINDLCVVGAKPHLWRCTRDLQFAIEERGATISIRYPEEIAHFPSTTWYCRDSTQGRTRSRWSWLKRELILMLMPMFIYKRVAS